MPAVVRPDRIGAFGSGEGAHFCLVSNPRLLDEIHIAPAGNYLSYEKYSYSELGSFEGMLRDDIPEPAHIFVVSPDCFFESPPPDVLGPRRKLVAMPSNSTELDVDALAHFLQAVEQTDVKALADRADHFFELAEAAPSLRIVDDDHGTEAVFDHLAEEYEWNEQAGLVEWGQQQIAPAGELSALPTDIMHYSPQLRLSLNGQIAMAGTPIVHSGAASFSRSDQQRIYRQLATMTDHAVIASIENGTIVSFRETHPAAKPARRMLDQLCEIDSRYRVVWEMGFGINTDFSLWPGNCGMNEMFGADNGVFHFGVGLTPFTQYAPIFLCPGSRVLGADDAVLVGPIKKRRLARTRGHACGCYPD